MIRKAAAVDVGGEGWSAEGGRLLLAEEVGGRQWPVRGFRKATVTLISSEQFLLLCLLLVLCFRSLLGCFVEYSTMFLERLFMLFIEQLMP